MERLPAEVLVAIASYLPHKSALEARLVNRSVSDAATYVVFRHIRLEDTNTNPFVHVAESSILRPLVREITIDYQGWKDDVDFAIALAHLVQFRNLKTLNLRFDNNNRILGAETVNGIMYRTMRQDNLRCFLLAFVFKYLAGTWSPLWQSNLQEKLRVHFRPSLRLDLKFLPVADVKQKPIELRALTMSDLAGLNDTRLTTSEEFKSVLKSKSLQQLKILVLENKSRSPLSKEAHFFGNLPRTWLCPSIAQNLRVLSLFGHDYWGWTPKMDFRTVNPGNGTESGFPNLRVLALGRYVFSHQWQVDWIASLGSSNGGRGGLRELYLDDCPIMWRALVSSPLDEGDTVCTTADGSELRISNEKYPVNWDIENEVNQDAEYLTYSFDLRWRYVLSRWRGTMRSLEVFKMGHGNWEGRVGSPPAHGTLRLAELRDQHPLQDAVFLDYDCPSPGPASMNNVFKRGVGMQQRREQVLQYITFNATQESNPWIEIDERRELVGSGHIFAYNAGRKADEEALEKLVRRARRRVRGKGSER
ncbi:hypothetical protein F4779DRAFT_562210 [Xylariaceae sp. FL0662B]|nr:hypothetical protein F4779DRAFT_562210 [Xylariaceae sp. FL0662B]